MLTSLFREPKPVIGVIHVGALPGTPAGTQSMVELVAAARGEARLYRDSGVDGIAIENMHDVPYLRGEVGPEIVAAMAVIGREVKSESGLSVGVQILAGANIDAMAVAHAAGLDFIRAEGYAFAHVADEGIIDLSFIARGFRARVPRSVKHASEATRCAHRFCSLDAQRNTMTNPRQTEIARSGSRTLPQHKLSREGATNAQDKTL